MVFEAIFFWSSAFAAHLTVPLHNRAHEIEMIWYEIRIFRCLDSLIYMHFNIANTLDAINFSASSLFSLHFFFWYCTTAMNCFWCLHCIWIISEKFHVTHEKKKQDKKCQFCPFHIFFHVQLLCVCVCNKFRSVRIYLRKILLAFYEFTLACIPFHRFAWFIVYKHTLTHMHEQTSERARARRNCYNFGNWMQRTKIIASGRSRIHEIVYLCIFHAYFNLFVSVSDGKNRIRIGIF